MKKVGLLFMTITGVIILLGGLLTYGLGVHKLMPVPRPDLIVIGTSLIGILFIISGVLIVNIPLIAFAIIFAVFHILISVKNYIREGN